MTKSPKLTVNTKKSTVKSSVKVMCDCHPWCEEKSWHEGCKCFTKPSKERVKRQTLHNRWCDTYGGSATTKCNCNLSNPKTSMEERFEKIEASITSPDGDRAWTKSIKGLDQYKEILTFIKAELKANDKKWEEKIKGMKVITMIGPGRFGDGKPTQVPTSEFGKGYNKALRDLLKDSLLERKK